MAEQLLESYAFEPEYTPEELEALDREQNDGCRHQREQERRGEPDERLSLFEKGEMRKTLNKKGGHAKLQWPVTKGGHPATHPLSPTPQPPTRGTRRRPVHRAWCTSVSWDCTCEFQ